MKLIQNFKNQVKGVFIQDYVVHKGVILPPPKMRLMGEKFYDNDHYLNSSLEEGNRLKTDLGVNRKTKMLEIGCSSGRSVIGLVKVVGPIAEYAGVDTKMNNVIWCNNHIAKKNKYCRFVHMDIRQIMFNPNGTIEVNENFHYPFPDSYFDLVYLNSVLPNNIDSEIKIYANEFYRLLKPGGKLFLTTFIEENVPPMTENPDNYVMICTYPRQIVRFEKNYFTSLFTNAGFKLSRYSQGTEIDTQSAVEFVK